MRRLKWATGAFTLAALLFLLVILPWRMSLAVSVPLVGTPAEQGLVFEEISLNPPDQSIAISGWWIPTENPKASILFIHGGNGNKADPNFGTLKFYKALHDLGFNVLAIDLRNHGSSDQSASGQLTFGREEKFDAAAGVKWIRARQPHIPLFAAGISMGGATLIHMTAAGTRTDGLILIDPVLNNQDVIQRGLYATLGWPKVLLAPTAWAADFYSIDSKGLDDPLEVAAKIEVPILLISDEYDPVATVKHARALSSLASTVRLVEIPKSLSDGPTTDQGRWAGHVTAFLRQPETVMSEIRRFTANPEALNRGR